MNDKFYCLSEEVIVEPLLNNWYAWINLISPAAYARYLQYHIKLLESYIQAPHLHQQANTEIRLRGGSFLDLGDSSQLDTVKELLRTTNEQCQELINFSKSIDLLNMLLIKYKTDSFSFNNLYKEIPDELKGLVELVYDLNNNPSFRFIETLVYESKYYLPQLQSVLLYKQDPDKRAFVLSTPRLSLAGAIQIPIPFKSSFYDELFKTRQIPLSHNDLLRLHDNYLTDTTIDFNSFKQFFSCKEINRQHYTPSHVADFQIKYFGHACVLVQTSSCCILIDPLVSYKNDQSKVQRYSLDDLPDVIDYVVITHGHQDHMVLETLMQIRYKVNNIIIPQNNKGALQDPSLKLALKHCGFNNIYELSDLESVNALDVTITALPFFGEHADLDIRSKAGYVISTKDKSLLFLADSKNLAPNLYKRLSQLLPPIDVAFIGLECEGAPYSWLYGPLMLSDLSRAQDQSRRLNGSTAAEGFEIVTALGCQRVCIYAMGYEPWLTFISNLDEETSTSQISEAKKLIQFCKTENIPAQLLYGSMSMEL